MNKIDATKYLQVVVPEPMPVELRFVVPAKYKTGVLKALDDIRALFGKNGQNWITGAEHVGLDAGDAHPETGKPLTKAFDGYCLIGGVYAVDGRYEDFARLAIAQAIMEHEGSVPSDLEDEYDVENFRNGLEDVYTITNFNDGSATWDDIKAVLKRAKAIVKAAPVK